MPFQNIFSKTKKIKFRNNIPIRIIADNREKNSLLISELIEKGCQIEFRNLLVADYITKNVAIERKTVSDLLSSIINKRIFRQLEELQQYEKRLLMIEGIDEQELYHKNSRINENAIRGFLLSVTLNFNTPIIFTKDYEDSAKFIMILAKKQEKDLALNAKKKARNTKEQLQYIIESFPGIGPKTAKKLLKEFKTINKLVNADFESLKKLIGKKAEIIFKLIYEKFE